MHISVLLVWDATAKSPTGVLRGNVFQMGHFEQCITSRAPFPTQYCLVTLTADIPRPNTTRDELSLFYHPQSSVLERLYVKNPQYYRAQIKIAWFQKFKDVSQQARDSIKAGWCIPASCTVPDLKQSLNTYLNITSHTFSKDNITYTADFHPQFCKTSLENEKTMTSADLVFW